VRNKSGVKGKVDHYIGDSPPRRLFRTLCGIKYQNRRREILLTNVPGNVKCKNCLGKMGANASPN